MTAQVIYIDPFKAGRAAHPKSIVQAALASEMAEVEERRAYDTSRICHQWIGDLGRFSSNLFEARARYGKSLDGVSRLLGSL